MTIVTMLVGALLLVVTVMDLVSTVVVVSKGPGRITGAVSSRLWRVFLFLNRRLGSHRLLQAAGPIIVFSIILSWLLLLITGWSLIFGAGTEPLVETGSGEPAANLGRMYFAAALILGRGSQFSQPASPIWRVVEQLAGASGVLLVTLSIAYVIPVVASITASRKVAAYISSLGTSPQGIVTGSWDGRSFGDLNLHLIALTPQVSSMSQRHLAYPVLHYFHTTDRQTAVAPSVVALDEALTLLEYCVGEEHRLHPSVINPLRAAISEFLITLRSMGIQIAEEALPRYTIDALRAGDIPVLSEDEDPELKFLEDLDERRRLLRALLQHDGWDWEGDWEGYAA